MAHSSPEICLHRGNQEDEWDDTALIEAYDRAMGAVKDKAGLKKKVGMMSRRTKRGSKTKWKIGESCQALYSVDNMLYEAIILEVNETENKCIVQFLGYENEEEVDIDSLVPSEGKASQGKQIEEAKKDTGKQWEVGDRCIALFSEDGMYYPAVILEVFEEHSVCLVKFTGYNNEEEVDMEHIHPALNHLSKEPCKTPAHAQMDQELSSVDESLSSFCSSKRSLSGARPERKCRGSPRSHSAPNVNNCSHSSHAHPPDCYFPPTSSLPVPANFDMQEEIGPMLMAWYMAGYHTGYYQGRTSRLTSMNMMVPQPPNIFHPH